MSVKRWKARQTAVYVQILDSEDRLVCFMGTAEPELAAANRGLVLAAPDLHEATKVAHAFLLSKKYGEECQYTLDEALEVIEAALTLT